MTLSQLEKGYQRHHTRRIPAVDKKRQGYSSFPKLSPYYSKHVLPYYLSRAASPQVDGYVYSMQV